MTSTRTQNTVTEWRQFTLGELLKFSNGINADKSAYGSGIPFANVLEVITHESLRQTDIPGRINLPPKLLARYIVRPADILFNRTSETQDEVGLTSVYIGDEPIVFGGFVFRGRPQTTELSVSYSKYALRSHAVRGQITARGQGGIRANIGQRDLKSVIVALPPVPEQHAIAEALDDVSRLVAHLARLIAKKQAIKQGMMQRLLTGKVRLPGFDHPWSETALAELATIVSGGTPKSSVASYWNGGIAWCTPTDVTRGSGRYLRSTERMISQEGLERSSARLLPKGSLLLCTRATIGEVKIAQGPIATNQGFKSLVPRPGASSEFLYYKLLTLKERLALKATGSTFLEISKRDVASVAFQAPDVDEQRVIAKVLADADDEIDTLGRRLAKAKTVKQGMMQELLTGRTRLSVEAAS
jgi:type I restriction enzyme S subunit